jgi:hypothetical protein
MQDGVLTIRGEKRATRWGGSCGSTLPSGASLPKDSGEVDMPDRSLALLVVAIVLLLPLASVRGAEPHDPVPGYTGGYHEHAADWSGARITQNFERCCGKRIACSWRRAAPRAIQTALTPCGKPSKPSRGTIRNSNSAEMGPIGGAATRRTAIPGACFVPPLGF